jgi:hypothetical protein
MGQALRPLLPRQQYSSLMERLGDAFGRYKSGKGVGAEQLLTMYFSVQAAVDGGEVGKVVSTLEDELRWMQE